MLPYIKYELLLLIVRRIIHIKSLSLAGDELQVEWNPHNKRFFS